MKTISLKAIDVGFDLRDCGMSVDLSREPDRLLVNYDGGSITCAATSARWSGILTGRTS